MCCSDEAELGTVSTPALGEAAGASSSCMPGYSNTEENYTHASINDTNEATHGQTDTPETPLREVVSDHVEHVSAGNEARQRTPPNTWSPSLVAPGAPRKQRPQSVRPRRPIPYDVRIALHDQREVGPILRVEDQPSALTSYFGSDRIRTMISAPSMGAHAFMTEIEQDIPGPEWTMSDDDTEL